MNKKYTNEQIINNLKKLRDELNHEPSTGEIDDCPYLPCARQVQRTFNGVGNLRKLAGFSVLNHTEGNTRSITAAEAQRRSSQYEARLINSLFKKHQMDTNVDVTRQFAYQQWLPDEGHYINISCDVALTYRSQRHVILVDFFYPNNMHSYGGCVRSKRKKLRDYPVSLFEHTHEIVFVCVNNDITQEDINNNGTNRDGVTVLSLASFNTRFL